MNPIWYKWVVNTCLIIVVVSALSFDRVSGVYQTLIGVAAVLAAIVSVITYFYNQHLLRKRDENGNS